jgi:hypothetical protein
LDANVVVIPALIGFVLLLTPIGKLPSPRWRWWARVAAAAPVVGLVSLTLGPFREPGQAVANPLAVGALAGPLRVVRGVAFAVAGLAIPVGAWSLVVRFRRARGVERQQLRWLAVAAVAVAVAALATQALTGSEVDLGWLAGVCLAVLPLAIGAAILRYRLYDLDRIISRTLAYGLLTLLLAVATPGSCWGWVSSWAGTPAWWWPGRPWRSPRPSSRPGAASSSWWTAASTGAATTPPRRSRRSAIGCASRQTWTP